MLSKEKWNTGIQKHFGSHFHTTAVPELKPQPSEQEPRALIACTTTACSLILCVKMKRKDMIRVNKF